MPHIAHFFGLQTTAFIIGRFRVNRTDDAGDGYKRSPQIPRLLGI